MKTQYPKIKKAVQKQKACSEDGTIARLKRLRQVPRRVIPLSVYAVVGLVVVGISFIY